VRKLLEQKMDIEKELAASLRAQDPGAAFTAAVLQRVEQPPVVARRRSPWRVPASLAAGLLLVSGALLVERQVQQRRLAAAGDELALALAITSAQLNDVQQKLSRNASKENGI
jgi:hypothetical protein